MFSFVFFLLVFLLFFCSFANGLAERYPELFEGDGTTSQHQANFGKKWRAYATIVELADGKLKEIEPGNDP